MGELAIKIAMNESMADMLLSALSSHLYSLRTRIDLAKLCNQRGEYELLAEAYTRAQTTRDQLMEMISANFDRS